MALLPILLFFLVFQVLFLHLRKKQVVKILVGMLYTFIGLTLFLTGVNVGFMPVGNFHRRGAGDPALSTGFWCRWACSSATYIVKAEPAVLVLNKQVEDITTGAISQTDHDGRPVRWAWRCRVGAVHAAGADGCCRLHGHPAPGLRAGAGAILCGAAHLSRPSPLTRAAWPPAP